VTSIDQTVPKKKFAPEVLAKSHQIKELFPEADLDTLNEYVQNNSQLSVEELVNGFLANSKIISK